MYHSILVCQDASEFSQRALELAVWLSTSTHARVHLVHLHSRKPHIRPKQSLDEMTTILRERFEAVAQQGIRGDWEVVEGWTPRALVSELKWHDLVVAGRHGGNADPGRRTIGSFPKMLLETSPIAVLIAADHPVVPDRLAVAFDNTLDACMALRVAGLLAAERQLKLHVVEVAHGHQRHDHLAHARDYLKGWQEVDAQFELLEGKPADAIVTYLNAWEIQLAFVSALSRTPFGPRLSTRIMQETEASLIVPRGQPLPIY